jgi:hypothetical protein
MKSLFLATICAVALGTMALSPSAHAQTKTVKECQAEWRANKDANQKAGITEKDYVAKCRAGTAPPPAPTPAPAPAPAPKPKTEQTPAPTGAGQFTTEALAKAHCPADIVVWVNLKSKIYHFAGHKDYGKTKQGAYMCEKEATTGGFRAAKNEKHP